MNPSQCKAAYIQAIVELEEQENELIATSNLSPAQITQMMLSGLADITDDLTACLLEGMDGSIIDCFRQKIIDDAIATLAYQKCMRAARTPRQITKCVNDLAAMTKALEAKFNKCKQDWKNNQKPQEQMVPVVGAKPSNNTKPGSNTKPTGQVPSISLPGFVPSGIPGAVPYVPILPQIAAPVIPSQPPSILQFPGVQSLAAAGESEVAGASMIPNPAGLGNTAINAANGVMIFHDAINVLGGVLSGQSLQQAIDNYINSIPQIMPGIQNQDYKPGGLQGMQGSKS